MNTKKPNRRETVSLFSVAFFMAAAMMITLATPAFADNKQDAVQLVEKAEMTLQSFMSDSSMDAFRDLAKQAKGILVVPQLLEGAFVFGASGGSGVLLVRDGKADRWFGPAFYTIGGASFGLQIGGQASEVILLMMTDRGVANMMASNFKLGVDAGVAAGPVGVGVAASTANLSADILTFSRSKGLYGGISLDGAVVATRGGLNEAYYGKQVTPTDIFVRREVTNPQAQGLISEVTKMACSAGPAGSC
jgi:lipid-binding SYLF domain-containing protein